jgi:hypothetical protein
MTTAATKTNFFAKNIAIVRTYDRQNILTSGHIKNLPLQSSEPFLNNADGSGICCFRRYYMV